MCSEEINAVMFYTNVKKKMERYSVVRKEGYVPIIPHLHELYLSLSIKEATIHYKSSEFSS